MMYSGWFGKYRSEEARRLHASDADRLTFQGEWCARAGETHRPQQANDLGSMARRVLVVILPLFIALLALAASLCLLDH